jgi:hypothetical protein
MPRLKDSGLDAAPVSVIHDEALLAAKTADAEHVARLLEGDMMAGMRDLFPEASTGA